MGLRKLALLSIAVLIAAGLLWKVIGSGTSSVVPDRSIGEREKLPAVSVLSVRPGLAGPASSPASLVPAFSPPVASANLSQFRARKDYASLYQRLQGDLSPEALYLKAEIYERCARHDGKSALDLAQESAARRAKFISGIPQSKADAPKRIEAFDRLYSDPCSGMDLGAFSSQEFARLLAAAADAGDVHAQATQLADRVEGANHESQGRIAYPMTEADLAQARQLLASADPDVINVLQGILSSTLESGSIRLDGEPFDPHAMYSAIDLFACDA